MSDGTDRQRGGGIRRLFVVLYLLVQITIPVAGLYLAHREEAPMRFSWHMFSRVRDTAADD